MAYEFSIDKKTGIILVTGYALVGVLLFVAGFLLGIGYHLPATPTEMVMQSPPAKAAETPVALPSEKPAEQSAEVSTPPPDSTPETLAPVPAPAPADEGQPAAPAPEPTLAAASPSPSSNAAPAPAKTLIPPAVTPTPAPAPTPAPLASAAAAAAEPSPSPASQEEYSLQVGSFIDPSNAARLAKELRDKGYKPTILNATDSHYRVWHAVRIGPYKDMQTAAKEAASLRQAEQILALVRPAKSL